MTKTLSAVAAGLCALTLSLGAYAASDESYYQKVAKKQTEAENSKTTKAACNKLGGTEKKRCLKKIPVQK